VFSVPSREIIPAKKNNNDILIHERKTMPLLLVAYDIKETEKEHSDLLKQIEKYSNVRLTESSYAVITDKTPKAVCEDLRKFIDMNDNVYVITLKHPYFGCGPGLANDWLIKGLTY
jgi:CRISPR-associated endonuclease Cas2